MYSARSLVALLAFVLGLGVVPHRICERDAAAFFGGTSAVEPLARHVATTTSRPTEASSFVTGSDRFNDEWVFGAAMMAAMGFGQIALAEERGSSRGVDNVARVERALDRMLAPSARAFDGHAWGQDPLASIAERGLRDRGHVAYLGYAGLALGLHRALVPTSWFSGVHEGIAAALARRFEASETGLLETYPGEVYPVDNAAALAAVALSTQHRSVGFARAREALRTRAIDGSTGLLLQSLRSDGGGPADGPRGSGTALAAYFLSYVDEDMSRALYESLRRELFRTVLGFGAVLEHPSGSVRSDVDSGPVVFGFGVSATGFALGASRAHGDDEAFTALVATAHLFGAPLDRGGERTHATGGPLGDAILLAMLTAPRAGAMRARSVR